MKSEIERLTERDLKQLRYDFVAAFGGELLGVDAGFTRGHRSIVTKLFFDDIKVDFLMTDHECQINPKHKNILSAERHLKVMEIWFRFIAGKVPEYQRKHDEFMLIKYDEEKFQI